MHPPEVREAALALINAGHNDCEVARMLGIPRRTIADWRRPTYARLRDVEICPRCWKAARPICLSDADYAELLGLYLGDGCISPGGRTSRLRITLDAKYPRIINEAESLMRRCFPENRVDVVHAKNKGKCVDVSVYSRHLPCVLPQHGPGKKHLRMIVPEPWQISVLRRAPGAFLRGCIRSDGSVFVNRTGPYKYLSYDFSNRSSQIVDLFCLACDYAGIEYRRTGPGSRGAWDVRINRRVSVAKMLPHVKPKS